MPYTLFHSRFPDVAKRETRRVTEPVPSEEKESHSSQ